MVFFLLLMPADTVHPVWLPRQNEMLLCPIDPHGLLGL